MQLDKINIELLIHKQLRGEISQDEQALLGEWRLVPENEIYYQDLVEIWNQSKNVLSSSLNFDYRNAYNRHLNKLSENNTQEVKPKVLSISLLRKIAAIFILGLVAMWWFTSGNQIKINTPGYHLLAEGSEIYLSENSTLGIDSKDNRKVYLDGQAFFKVSRDEKHPFVINANSGKVEVLGTEFEVNERGVFVKKGKVRVSNPQNSQSIILVENENAQFESLNQISLNDENQFNWFTERLAFKNTPMSKVVKEISEVYNVHVTIDDNSSETNCLFNSKSLCKLNLHEVFDVISSAYDCNIKETSHGNYVITNLKCK